jgi:hypothetical protein
MAEKAQDYLTPCDSAACKADQQEFLKWYPRAVRGDYQGQRNVAFMLGGRSAGQPTGAIAANKITACAWRMVIVTSGSLKVNDGDTFNLKHDCGKLDDVERQAAAAQATLISSRIRR